MLTTYRIVVASLSEIAENCGLAVTPWEQPGYIRIEGGREEFERFHGACILAKHVATPCTAPSLREVCRAGAQAKAAIMCIDQESKKK